MFQIREWAHSGHLWVWHQFTAAPKHSCKLIEMKPKDAQRFTLSGQSIWSALHSSRDFSWTGGGGGDGTGSYVLHTSNSLRHSLFLLCHPHASSATEWLPLYYMECAQSFTAVNRRNEANISIAHTSSQLVLQGRHVNISLASCFCRLSKWILSKIIPMISECNNNNSSEKKTTLVTCFRTPRRIKIDFNSFTRVLTTSI
jgi:hypothetical protein